MAAQKQTNWFAIWTSAAVVVVLIVVGVLVVWMNTQQNKAAPSVSPTASNIDTKTGAIKIGTGSQTVDTYVDFMCPACQNFESVYGPTIQKLVDAGTITLNLHPISILDRYDSAGTQYSTRAASAMYCVAAAAPDKASAFLKAMYANKPEENTPGLTDAKIVAIAEGVGVTDAASCIESGRYKGYVTSMTTKTPVQPSMQGISTPTIAINGKTVDNQTELTGDPQKDIVARLK